MAKRNARWYGPKARALLLHLCRRAAMNTQWMGMTPQDILADINSALTAAYNAPDACPQSIFISRSSYMLMTGHIWVKLGRRGGRWVKR